MHTLYGSQGSGSAALEMGLLNCRIPYRVMRASTWEADSARAELAAANPLGQIPTLVLPGGEVLTESAAILVHLGLSHPSCGLLPSSATARAQSIRGLVYLATNCYAAIGVIDYPERWTTTNDKSELERLQAGTRLRLHACWDAFADTFPATPFLSGSQPGALDFLAVVVSR